MTCEQFSSLLQDYLEGSLSEHDRAMVDAHLADCAQCRLQLQIRQDCQRLDEHSEVPASFSSSWRAAIKKEEESMQDNQTPGRQTARPAFKFRRWMAVAAALVFVVGGTLLMKNPRQAATDASTPYGLGSNYAPPVAEQSMAREAGTMYDMAAEPMAPQAAKAASPAKIIRTVSLGLVSRDFEQDLARLQALLAQQGGYVEYSDISADRGARRYASLTLRVPKDNLDSFLEETSGVGRRLSMTQSQEDVSEQYLDMDTRLATQKTKMTRLQELLGKAMKVEDVLAIEREIADTQYQIDSLTGSLRGIDAKVDYAKVSVSLSEESVSEEQPARTLWDRIRLAVSDAWYQAKAFLSDMLIFVIVVLPYVLAAALVIYIIYRLIRRKKNK